MGRGCFPVSGARRDSAIRALEEVRANFNGGDCHFSLVDAQMVPFSKSIFDPESPQWAGQCRDLMSTLGAWRSFALSPDCQPQDRVCLGGSPQSVNETVNLSGTAEFANSTAKFTAVVRFEGDTAWLWSLKITSSEEKWSFPADLSGRRFEDPPTPPSMRRGGT